MSNVRIRQCSKDNYIGNITQIPGKLGENAKHPNLLRAEEQC